MSSSGASGFDLIPAVDLRAGRVVRLLHGAFDRETVYGDDPVAMATALVEAGARWIHVVDLDGARDGRPSQVAIVGRIVAAVGRRAACQVAGGLRTPADVEAALAAGATRVVVGTAALVDPAFAAAIVATHGSDRVVAALDIRDGMAIGEGWVAGAAGVPAESALDRLADAGIVRFAATAIARDGGLDGPDLELLGALVDRRRGAIVASGGVASIADLLATRAAGCEAAIVGRAIYEGRIDVGAALAAIAAGGPT
jgi:phosphoribosylformimino-5-aminoimidazole carboxamide ribotide isomerase